MRLRGALVGCGMISEFHLRAWQRIPEVEIVALVDSRLDAAQARRDAFAPQARVYQDLGALLGSEKLDFVDVLTPPALHFEHCTRAAEAGAHVVCQKPLAEDPREAARLVEAIGRTGRRLAVHENHRFRPWVRELREHLEKGTFGTPRFLRIEQFDAQKPPEAFKTEGKRGILLDYGVHLVDLVRALLGDPRRVHARAHRPHPGVRGESLMHVTYELDGATGVIDIGWKAPGLAHAGLLLVGDRGEALYEGTLTRGATGRLRILREGTVIVDEARDPTREYIESFHLFEREFVDAVLTGAPLTQTGSENLRTLIATFAAYTSSDEGRTVEIDYGLGGTTRGPS